jgi:arylsulfatase A-like enzyme
MKHAFFYLLSILILMLFITACGPKKQTEPDILFLITLDTTRADHFDYTLSNNSLTPNFARLASEGIYFENAYALVPITLPSHASMFYSLPPHRLKIYTNRQTQKVTRPSVTQLLKGKGYFTAAVISLGVLKAEFGLNKGFDRYIENFKPYLWIKEAGEVNRDAFELIKKKRKEKGEKSFFWIHYSDPHEPYFPHPQKKNEDENGDFNLSLNGKKVFTCRSTEQATVKVDIHLEPGKNTLTLDTGIPTVFKNYNDCTVEYIKYEDFSIEPLSPTGNSERENLEILPPVHWTSKKDNHTQQVNYYSSQTRSILTITNKNKTTTPFKLSFFYSLHVNDAARKQFYSEEIKYMDRRFGELIDFLKEQKLYEQSTFIVMGDHGEGLGEYRNHFGHIHYLNKVYCQVPLIVAGAGIRQRGKREELVSTLNIAPTILDLVHIKKPEFMLGESLLKPLTPKKLLLETYSPEAYFDAFSLIDFPWQIIFYPGRREGKLEFINLKTDPLGTINLNNIKNITDKTNTDEIKKIKARLINSILKISRIITATKGKIGNSSERHREILKSLGYL